MAGRFSKKKCPAQGKAVAGHGQGEPQPPAPHYEGHDEHQDDQGGADEMQSSAGAVAVLAEVIRVELGEGIESFGVFQDCRLFGYCSGNR